MMSRRMDGFLAAFLGIMLFLAWEKGAQSFPTAKTFRSPHLPSTRLHIIGVETIGFAIISAAAGAASQVPKIQQLEGELTETRAALEQSKEDMKSRIAELEDKLFLMDKAYEDQSQKFIVEYEKRKDTEVAKVTEKMKADFKYKLDIEVEKQKAKLLMKKLSDASESSDQTIKLAEMKLKMSQLEKSKSKLEKALADSESELQLLNKAEGKKANSWFSF